MKKPPKTHIFPSKPANVDAALRAVLEDQGVDYKGFKITRELTLMNGKLKVEFDLQV